MKRLTIIFLYLLAAGVFHSRCGRSRNQPLDPDFLREIGAL
jgi:hypothetical protein